MSDRFRGLILGAAVGDALGLPAEGLSRRRAQRLYRGHWRHRFVWGRGMVSDDTDHVVFVAQSLLAQPSSAEAFARHLGWSLRWWLLALPAGIGWGTLRAIARLWLGIPANRSGVRSAGNGPAMRVAPIGAFFAGRSAELEAYVWASTRLTHLDERAGVGALAVARLVSWSIREELEARPPLERFLDVLRCSGDAEWSELVTQLGRAAERGVPVHEFAAQLGLERGVTSYTYHTVPVAAYAWFRHFGDFRASLVSVLDCGGDTDTAGAIVGALAGAVAGESGIPGAWIEGIAEWPRNTALLRELADRLAVAAKGASCPPLRYFWPAVIPRNVAFFLIVLAHGLRRLAPPY